jgi:DNA repair protein RecN (Recombination protein N)
MLTELRIRNFAIVESVTLPLASGFNILSGETGAGKSIIVGALGFLLGERSSTDLVRPGTDRAAVEGLFEVRGLREVLRWANELGIEIEDEMLILKRELTATGRSRAWANSSAVTATALADVGRLLVSLHGQHEAQTLVDAASQRAVLDGFAQAETVVAEVRDVHQELATTRAQIAALSGRRQEAGRREDYLRHVVNEIESARLSAGEETSVEEEARVLEHADELRELSQTVHSVLADDDSGVLPRLAAARRSLAAILRIDPSAADLQNLFDLASPLSKS